MRAGPSSSSSASTPWIPAVFGLVLLLEGLISSEAVGLQGRGVHAEALQDEGTKMTAQSKMKQMRGDQLARQRASYPKEGPNNELNSASATVPDTSDITAPTEAPNVTENGLDPTEDKTADPFDDDDGSKVNGDEMSKRHGEKKVDLLLPDGVSNTTGPNRTVKDIMDEISKMDSNHKEDITSFMKNIRNDLDVYCTHGTCQAVLDKLERGVKRIENRHRRFVKSMVPTTPPPIIPELLRNSPDWSGNFSTYVNGSSPPSRLPISSVKCMEQYCATLQVKYLEQDMDVWDRGNWSEVVGDGGQREVHCPPGKVVSQIRCTGMFCGSLQLLCQKTNVTVWQVDDTATEAKGWFNELEPGVSACSEGYTLFGLACHGPYCHSKRLLCKGTKPPARDCLFGPWSDWSDCGGECDNSLQMRNRSVYYDQRWGSRCWGPREHKRECTQRRCVESDSLSESDSMPEKEEEAEEEKKEKEDTQEEQ